ncbi:MAG: hypothetical protein BGO95_00650 [Micrococcales bacterium 73-13]|nr:MAG: hypothetical protein BGO95_00650 [Micrococcales bacterium 73-13]
MSADAGSDAELVAELREVHRSFPTGVTIVATTVDGRPYGLAVNAFASVSLAPPLVMVCVAATASSYPFLFRGDDFAISLLAADQSAVATAFGRSGGDKFAGVRWHPAENGAPLIDGATAELEVTIASRSPAGTHTIFLARVVRARARGRRPLLYLGSRFFDPEGLEPLVRPGEATA